MKEIEDILNGLIIELRRGTLVLCVLSMLKESNHGYNLVQALTEQGLDVKADTLYPLLRRLESQKLLQSTWNDVENRARKNYILTEEGKYVLESLIEEWQLIQQQINKIIIKGDVDYGTY